MPYQAGLATGAGTAKSKSGGSWSEGQKEEEGGTYNTREEWCQWADKDEVNARVDENGGRKECGWKKRTWVLVMLLECVGKGGDTFMKKRKACNNLGAEGHPWVGLSGRRQN